FGPVAAYNALCLIAPTMAGWAAFVLCRWLSRGYWSSLAAGWVFGFSAYTVSAITTHLHTLLVFPIPLIVWLSLRYAAGELHRRRLVATVALLIFAQFMFCAEIVATAALVGALFFTVVYALGSETTRHSLMRLPAPLAAACGIAAVFLSPYLYFMFAFGHPGGVVLNPEYHGADLLNLLVPTGVNELGKLGALAAISRTYRATLTESGSYLPLPLVVIALLLGRERWAEPTARALIYSIIATCVLAMGARFVIGGHPTFGAPWYLLTRLPLLRKALPVRLMMYVFLGLAVIAAMWLSTTRRSALLRASLAIGLLPFMMPNLSTSYWSSAFEIPEFFSSGAYRQYLEPGENVMVVPALIYGDGMQWQVASGMYFRLAGGYIGLSPLAPPEYARWPIMAAFYDTAGIPDAGEQLKAMLAHQKTSAIIVGPSMYRMVDRVNGDWTAATWIHPRLTAQERSRLDGLLSDALGVRPLEVGGVELYRIPPAVLAPYAGVTALEMQRRYIRARFELLLRAAHEYLAAGGDLDGLQSQPERALRLEPVDWFGGPAFPALSPNRAFQVAWALGQWHKGRIAVGVQGAYEAVKPLIDRYGRDSSAIYFPFPQTLGSPPAGGFGEAPLMVMEFTPAGLARAAAATGAIARPAARP